MSHFSVAVFMTNKEQSIDDLLAPFNENLVVDMDQDKDRVAEVGDVSSGLNPNAKWDYYCIGGRWKNMLLLKDERKGNLGASSPKSMVSAVCDAALVSDIDFETMERYCLAELRPYEEAMRNSCMKEKYMRKRFRNEEEYDAWVIEQLKEAEREAADPNTKRITWEEFREEVEAYFYEMESRTMAKSA